MKNNSYKMTAPQNSIWLTEQYYQGTNINNICASVIITQKVNFEKLKKAINIFIKNTDSFKIKLFMDNTEVKQYISDYVPFDIDVVDVASEDDVKKLESEIVKKTFNLIENLLFTFKLFKFKNGCGGFIINAHHIISDSWTIGTAINEIIKIYSCLLNNGNLEECINNFSYIDYINSEKEYLESEKFLKDKQYWDNIYMTVPEVASFPSTNTNNFKKISINSNRESFNIESETLNNINNFCKQNKVSAYNFFMAIFAIYLSRVSNLDDFVIGTPILNRTNFKEKNTSGMFINSIPFRISVENNESFKDLISKISTDSLSMLRHQKYSYQYILENLRKQDSSIPNLYNVVLSYQVTKTVDNSDSVPHITKWVFNGTIQDDLEINLYEFNSENGLNISYDYLVDKYSKEDIISIHKRILHIIDQIINDNNIDLKNIEIVAPEEKKQILLDFNNTKVEYPKDKAVVKIFEERVKENPDNIAVIFEKQKLTYRELNEKANQLAHYFASNKIKEKSIIGIMLNRSLETIICMLAVLKANCAYMLIDVNLPEDRILYMLNNAKSPLLITSSNVKDIKFENKLNLDKENYSKLDKNNLNLKYDNDNTFCIIYTSGSTGTPKGVELKNKGVVNLVLSYRTHMNTDICSNFISISTVSFDMFIVETYVPLLSGKTIVLTNAEEQKIPTSISDLIKKHDVEFILTTPSRIELLLTNDDTKDCLKKLKVIQLGGEVFTAKLFNKLQKYTKANIYNGYGPSEITACCSNKNITSSDITIGKPFCNTQIYILNKDMNLCPIGVEGEICVSGDGISRGYINNPTATEKVFVKNPYGEGTLYRTGDIGKYNSNGEILYIGRKDFQIKMRGLRIELSEIEKQILNIEGIKNCAVVFKQESDNNSYLVGFYTSTENIDNSYIRAEISKHLPLYMVPKYIIKLDNMPITRNGKIDLKVLREYKITNNEALNYVAPENEIEKLFCDIWEKLLKTKVGIDDDVFSLGADSLLAIKFKVELLSYNIDIKFSDIFEYPTVKQFYKANSSLKLKKDEKTNIIPKAEKQEYYPASSAQKRIYYASNLDGNNSLLYNVAGGIIFDKILDTNKLEQCFNQIINRHESLRTYFEVIDGNIVQKILEKVDFKLEFENSNNTNIDELFNNFVKPFDLSKAPLFNAKLINLNNKKSLLLFNMHHIISDGTSVSILFEELCKLYNDSNDLPEINISYKDFAVWENNKLKSNGFNKDKEFWVNKFNDEIPLLNMPTNYVRPNVQNFEGDNVYSLIDEGLNLKISNLSKKLGVTPYMILLSIYYILLYKYTGQNDIIVGSPIVGRDNPQLSNIIGMFVNSIPLRNKIQSDITFKEFVEIVKENCLEAFEHQTYPFDELINALEIKRDTSRNPLFDTMFIFQNNGATTEEFDGIKTENYEPKINISKFDLSLEIVPENNNLNLRFEYCTKLFNKEFITKLSNHYLNILKLILENEEITISDIDMISGDEKNQILKKFNNTVEEYEKEKTVVQIFENQVAKNPEKTAVIFEGEKLSYKKLNEKANELANYLRAKNIKENSIIGIMLDRSFETIICMLGVLKANCAYMLIDVNLPEDRIEYMLNNAKSPLLITTSNIKNINFNSKLFLDKEDYSKLDKENLNLKYDINNTFCIIYTSGSTGTPKGVELKNKGVVNLVLGHRVHMNTDICDRFISISTVAFDMFIVETFVPLLSGKTIILSNAEEQKIPTSISELIKRYDAEFILTTPSRIELLLTNDETKECLKKLKVIQLGGEVFTPKLYDKLQKYTKANIYNGYGPSEITACCAIKKVTSNEITIGKPFCNTEIYILNSDLNLCPAGIQGEICIYGDGLAKGYINNREATEKAFVKNPFKEGLIYKTGDIGKYNSNGELEYIGRKDFQIKMRGLRIELSEIEKQLLNIEGITNCAVVYKEQEDNNSYLVGFFTAKEEMDTSYIRAEISKYLPLYMVPKYIIQIEDMPITRNGKIDLKVLKEYKIKNKEKENYVAPENDLQKLFCKVWEKLLKTKVGITDDIFELGADSLLAIKFKVEMLSNNVDVQYADIFKYPTVKELSEANSIGVTENTENYDYTKINNVLEKNNIKNCKNITTNKNNNILLLGSNGFVGMHILYDFIKHDNGNIYCIVRDKNKLSARTRFLDTLHFYFNEELDEFIDNRIIIVKGDITKENFGLNSQLYDEIINNISIVINSSANVKHYGNIKSFENINIGLTEKAIEFCENYNKRLIQISSISVSGDVNTDKNITFSESNLYIGQELDNVYIKSKFDAERIVLEHISNGLKAQILRLGNVTNRYSDGKFQINPDENAFIARLQSFIKLGVIPDYLLNTKLEFTPVDLCAKAIILIMQNYVPKLSVFHLYNDNCITLKKFLEVLKQFNICLDTVNQTKFSNVVKDVLKDSDKKDILSGIINELNKNNDIQINSNIDTICEFSKYFLNIIDFNWSKIDNKYIEKYIEYFKKIKFI